MNTQNCTIGFIGYGSMATAIVKGLIGQQAVTPEQVYVCAKNWDSLQERAAALGLHPCQTPEQVAKASDIVVISVEPRHVAQVVTPIREILREKVVISVVAGFYFNKWEELLLPGTHHLSTIPNTPVSVGAGIIICEDRHSLTEEEYAAAEGLMSSIGLVVTLDDGQIGAGGTVAGCGPAFTALYVEALADGAVKYGVSRQKAYQLASQMLIGTGKMLLETGMHPGQLKDGVCSPGGTTILGVSALEENNLRRAVISALDAVEGR